MTEIERKSIEPEKPPTLSAAVGAALIGCGIAMYIFRHRNFADLLMALMAASVGGIFIWDWFTRMRSYKSIVADKTRL